MQHDTYIITCMIQYALITRNGEDPCPLQYTFSSITQSHPMPSLSRSNYICTKLPLTKVLRDYVCKNNPTCMHVATKMLQDHNKNEDNEQTLLCHHFTSLSSSFSFFCLLSHLYFFHWKSAKEHPTRKKKRLTH
jgi:hypothetical protein